MGYPYHELVPVAILWDNPGVTKEEFAQLLDRFKGGDFEVPKGKKEWDREPARYEIVERVLGEENHPFPSLRSRLMTTREIKSVKAEKKRMRKIQNLVRWDLKGYRDQDSDFYHQGLYGLGYLLNLKDHVAFQKEMSAAFPPQKDEFGLYYNDVRLFPLFKSFIKDGNRHLFMELNFSGPSYLSNKSEFGRFYVQEEKQKGEVVDSRELDIRAPYGLVEKTVKTHRRKNGSIKSQVMKVRGIHVPSYSYNINVEELVQEYPFFAPEKMFDFTQDRGKFWRLDNSYEDETFRWFQKDGKYYLDEERMMDNITTGGLISKGYTDLIITREAVRNNAWKLLTYRGLSHLECFFKRFPSAKAAYEKAVVDSHTSTYAKTEKMTHTELMRFRLLGQVNEEIRRAESMLRT